MGANFINTILEAYARELREWSSDSPALTEDERDLEVIMSILSNHTPNCLVRAAVSCPIEQMNIPGAKVDAADFVRRFQLAVNIARQDVYRAVTHNKGIMNGIDAVVLATGNDFRAVEGATHAFAAEGGQYRSLSRCRVVDDVFHFELSVPLALGTVGGLTKLHPLADIALDILGRPTAPDLMRIAAAAGLAQNFAALRSLITTGIQQGHMGLHARRIAYAAGARGTEIDAVAEELGRRATYGADEAAKILGEIRAHGERQVEHGT
jgi:hydroxymethylglutaryl-CoA reductase